MAQDSFAPLVAKGANEKIKIEGHHITLGMPPFAKTAKEGHPPRKVCQDWLERPESDSRLHAQGNLGSLTWRSRIIAARGNHA